MARISLAALTCATLGLPAATRTSTPAEASQARPDNENSTYDDDKLTGNNGVLLSDPSQFVQTNYWYLNKGTAIAGRSATANVTLQAAAGLKHRLDPTNEGGFLSAPSTDGDHMQNETSMHAATQPAATQQIAGRGGWPRKRCRAQNGSQAKCVRWCNTVPRHPF